MSKPTTYTRRELLTHTAMAATAIGTAGPAAASTSPYVFDAPETISMRIVDSEQRFPVRRVYCLGRNYRAHAIESGDNPDETPPFFFIKPRDAVVDARDGFPYPPMTKELRYEVEMVVALSSGGSNIAEEDALDCVFGYGVGIDMTRQDLQEIAQSLSRPGPSASHSTSQRLAVRYIRSALTDMPSKAKSGCAWMANSGRTRISNCSAGRYRKPLQSCRATTSWRPATSS